MNHPIFGNVNLPVRPSTITTKARETKATEPPTPTSLASTKSAASTRSARERTVVRQHPIDREKARRPTNGFRRKAQQGPEIWDAPKVVKECCEEIPGVRPAKCCVYPAGEPQPIPCCADRCGAENVCPSLLPPDAGGAAARRLGDVYRRDAP